MTITTRNDSGVLENYTGSLSNHIKQEYYIDPENYRGDVKRGLRNSDGTGVTIGATRVGSVMGYMIEDGFRVPVPGQLYYRGIELNEIVEAHRKAGTFGFEEVAYLLLMGYLPSRSEMDHFNQIMNDARRLPSGFTEDMIMKSPSKNIMNKLGRSVLSLYSYDDDPDNTSIGNMLLQSVKLIGAFPSIVANAYSVKRHYFDGDSLHIHFPEENLSTAENFLRMIRPNKMYTEEEAHLLDMMLMVHAEHGGGNNSTFTCRVLSSSGTDAYSAYAAAIGSLKGPKHGGANAKVGEMFDDIAAHVKDTSDDEELSAYLAKILRREAFDRSGLIYGLGHAVYTVTDPRAELVKKYAGALAAEKGKSDRFELIKSVERLGPGLMRDVRGITKSISTNVDMYTGFVYGMLGIPEDMFTPIFAMARLAGWVAHRMEELYGSKRIIRPAYNAYMKGRTYRPIDER